MSDITYEQRRGQIENYFDRTAAAAWATLTSDAPVGRIRATVRAGRDQMRSTLVSWPRTTTLATQLLNGSVLCSLRRPR